jgi:hypothetical protein
MSSYQPCAQFSEPLETRRLLSASLNTVTGVLARKGTSLSVAPLVFLHDATTNVEHVV